MGLNITKTGILTTNLFLEKGYQINTRTSFSYVPTVDTINSCSSNITCDFSFFSTLNQSLKITIDGDLIWGDFTGSTENSDFRLTFGGPNRQVSDGTYVWAGSNYLSSMAFENNNFTNLILNNITGGTQHFHNSRIIPASWFQTYNASNLRIRCDYRKGTGSIGLSNVKITFDSFIDEPFIASFNKEYIAGGQFYEY